MRSCKRACPIEVTDNADPWRRALHFEERQVIYEHMPTRARATSMLLLILGGLIPGCVPGDEMLGGTPEQRDAEKVVGHYFSAIATNGLTTALQDYGERFFQHTTRADWIQRLAQLRAEQGTFRSYDLSGRTLTTTTGASGTDTKVSLLFQVTYSKGSTAEEFTLAKDINGSDYRIIAHKIDTSNSRARNPNLSFIGAGLCGLWSVLALAAAFCPSIRAGVRWVTAGGGGWNWARGKPMSAGSAAAWALAALVWSITLLAVGARYEPITRFSGWLLAATLVLLIAAHLRDWSNLS